MKMEILNSALKMRIFGDCMCDACRWNHIIEIELRPREIEKHPCHLTISPFSGDCRPFWVSFTESGISCAPFRFGYFRGFRFGRAETGHFLGLCVLCIRRNARPLYNRSHSEAFHPHLWIAHGVVDYGFITRWTQREVDRVDRCQRNRFESMGRPKFDRIDQNLALLWRWRDRLRSYNI